MKICHVNNYARGWHRYVGGAETAMARTAALARDAGHDVFLVTLRPDRPRGEPEFRARAVRTVERLFPRPIRRSMEVLKWYVWQRDPLASRDFARILQEERPDVVHVHNIQFPGLDLIWVAKEAGARVCYTVYDYWVFCPNVMLLTNRDAYCRRFHGAHCVECLPPVLRGLQRRLLARRRSAFDPYLRQIDRWIVLSQHSAGVVAEYGIPSEKIRLVRLSLPTDFASLEPEDGSGVATNAIFFAGWLQRRKGVHVLLEAMPTILRQCPEAHLRIAGLPTRFEGDYKRKLRRLMRGPGMKDHVTFLGHLSSREIERELRRCAVVAIPEQYENMSPLLMIEAMTLARPIVISRAGGIPEYIEEGITGWLADPRRPDEFAEKILYVLKHGDEAKEVGRRARVRVIEMCNSQKIASDTLTAYA